MPSHLNAHPYTHLLKCIHKHEKKLCFWRYFERIYNGTTKISMIKKLMKTETFWRNEIFWVSRISAFILKRNEINLQIIAIFFTVVNNFVCRITRIGKSTDVLEVFPSVDQWKCNWKQKHVFPKSLEINDNFSRSWRRWWGGKFSD